MRDRARKKEGRHSSRDAWKQQLQQRPATPHVGVDREEHDPASPGVESLLKAEEEALPRAGLLLEAEDPPKPVDRPVSPRRELQG